MQHSNKKADVSEVTPASASRFSLKLTDEVFDFIALNTADRDSWVHTINLKVTEAKECLESVTTSEGYKAAFEKFGELELAILTHDRTEF